MICRCWLWCKVILVDRFNMVLTIAMVSDFFYPNMGGVESHIFQVVLWPPNSYPS